MVQSKTVRELARDNLFSDVEVPHLRTVSERSPQRWWLASFTWGTRCCSSFHLERVNNKNKESTKTLQRLHDCTMPTNMRYNMGAHGVWYYQWHRATAARSLVCAQNETWARCISVSSAGERRLLATTSWCIHRVPHSPVLERQYMRKLLLHTLSARVISEMLNQNLNGNLHRLQSFVNVDWY